MSHQDSRTNSAYLDDALQWLFQGVCFHRKLRDDCSWSFVWLCKTALLWAWSAEPKLTQRFACAQRLTMQLQGSDAKNSTSWQAFIEILRRHTDYLRGVISETLRRRMVETFPDLWRMYGYVVLGVDGSQVEVPRTRSNEDVFSAKKSSGKRCRRKQNGDQGASKRSESPQILLTTLFHVGLHLPWDWRIGSRGDSERGQLREMLDGLPKNCLLAADAGFVGYELAAAILDRGAQIVMRVGSNVRLLRNLGYARQRDEIVHLWPDKTASRRNQPPLVFRLLVIQGAKEPVYLITSVLSSHRLTDRQITKIYSARWRIEVYHRHLKQTFGRAKLLSRNAGNARIELEWSLLGLWAMGVYASAELSHHDIRLERLSFAGVLSAFREMARDYLHPADRQHTLRILLRRSLLDTYQRKDKSSRDYPRKKKHKSPGAPKIVEATPEQRGHAKRLLNNP